MFKLLKKLVNMLQAFTQKLSKYAMKHPIRMLISAFALYMCCSDNLMGKIRDLVGVNGTILEPKHNDVEEETQNTPETDDISMYKNSSLHTSMVADKSAQLEDLINNAHL